MRGISFYLYLLLLKCWDTVQVIFCNSPDMFSLVVNVRTGLIFVNCLSEHCKSRSI